MSDPIEATKLLEQHSNNPVSIMFLPKNMFERGASAQWIGQETLGSLRDIIELIIARSDDHAGYRILVNVDGRDDFLEQSVIENLLDYVITDKKSAFRTK